MSITSNFLLRYNREFNVWLGWRFLYSCDRELPWQRHGGSQTACHRRQRAWFQSYAQAQVRFVIKVSNEIQYSIQASSPITPFGWNPFFPILIFTFFTFPSDFFSNNLLNDHLLLVHSCFFQFYTFYFLNFTNIFKYLFFLPIFNDFSAKQRQENALKRLLKLSMTFCMTMFDP